jgi:hypothetical protein
MTGADRSDRHEKIGAWLLLLTIAPAYLYLNVFTPAGIPFHLGGDQTFFWTYALRMLHGERVYRDFFQFTPPGADLFFLGLFRLFGPRLWVLNAAVILLGTALCSICYSIGKQLIDESRALIAALLFLVLGYGRLLDATHHWFSLLLLLCALRTVMPEWTTRRIVIAGALLGLASFFTQTAGVAGLIALLLSRALEARCTKQACRTFLGDQLFMLAAFLFVAGAMNGYLIAMIGWKQFWYCQISYPARYVEYGRWHISPGVLPPLSWSSLPDAARRVFIYGLVVATYPIVLLACWSQRCSPAVRNTIKLSLLGLVLLVEIITRTNWLRIYAVSAPAFILLVWSAGRYLKPNWIRIAGWAVIGWLGAVQVWSRHHYGGQLIALPAGKAVVSPEEYEKFSWIEQHTKPGDFFYQALWVNTYPPLQLRSPVFLDVLYTTEQTRPEFVLRIVQQLEAAGVKYILWSPELNKPDFPARPLEDHLDPLRGYLRGNYRPIRSFPDGDEIWERR